jgi:hypothetical protein
VTVDAEDSRPERRKKVQVRVDADVVRPPNGTSSTRCWWPVSPVRAWTTSVSEFSPRCGSSVPGGQGFGC